MVKVPYQNLLIAAHEMQYDSMGYINPECLAVSKDGHWIVLRHAPVHKEPRSDLIRLARTMHGEYVLCGEDLEEVRVSRPFFEQEYIRIDGVLEPFPKLPVGEDDA